jgi:DNA-binding HxlR family transcriptional regulator
MTRPDRRTPDHDQVDRALLPLIRRPYVAEVLAALDEHPRTMADLRGATGGPRGLLATALYALAAHGAVAREPAGGSWDTIDRARTRYRLTPGGRTLIDLLFRLDVWQAAYRE